jgi:hypothetical protein
MAVFNVVIGLAIVASTFSAALATPGPVTQTVKQGRQ